MAAESVAQKLADESPDTRAAGLRELAESDQAVAELPAVLRLLGDADSIVRQAAVDVFAAVGEKGVGQAAALAKTVSGDDCGAAAAAACALAAIGPSAFGAQPSVYSALEAALGKRDEDKRGQALVISGVRPKLAPEMRKPACGAAAALAAGGAEGAKAAARVAELLGDSDADLRAVAAKALGAMGKAGARHEGRMLELLSDRAPAVVAAACDALGAMAAATEPSAESARAVAEHLGSPHAWVKTAAARSLASMGEEAQPHVKELVRLLNDPGSYAAYEAVRALGKSGEHGQMYAGKVAGLTGAASHWMRAAACEALGNMGARGEVFAEYLEECQWDESEEVQQAVKGAFAAFEALHAAREAPISIEDSPAIKSTDVPASGVGLLFPGQGSQYKGMLKGVADLPGVQRMLTQAKDILGYDLYSICVDGPEEKLEETQYCQPCMYVAGLAGVEKLKSVNSGAAGNPQAVAGLSLGEYTALTIAGVMDFETGLKLVKLRAEAMQEAAAAPPQGMASIAGLEKAKLAPLCKESAGPGEICKIANVLFDKGFACAGHKEALDRLVEKATAAGAMQAKMLKTKGAFHTDLMLPAKAKLLKALEDAQPKMSAPKCDIYMNVSGKRIAAGTPPSEFVPLLADQLCSEVLWEPSVSAMIADGVKEYYECGPMKQLTAMMKRINQKIWKDMKNIDV